MSTYQIAHKVETLAAILRIKVVVGGNVDGHALGVRLRANAVLATLGRLPRPVLRLAGQRDVVVQVLAPRHQQHCHRVVVETFVLQGIEDDI
jgi:hypothetical protein